MKNLIFICCFINVVFSNNQNVRDSSTSNESYSFSIGMVNDRGNGPAKLCTSTMPVEGYNYFVTNQNGHIIGKVDSFVKDSKQTCDGWMTIWNIKFNNSKHGEFYVGPYQYLIIRTKYNLKFDINNNFYKLDEFPVDDLIKLTTINEIKSSSSTMSIYNFGRTETIKRYGIVLSDGNVSVSRMIIVDVSHKSFTIIFNREISEDHYSSVGISNMTDLNNDGFADTFILDFGNIKGLYILSTHSGEWKMFPATPYDPC